MNEVKRASAKFEETIKLLEHRFSSGINIDNVDSFRHFASAWYDLGYAVGQFNKNEEENTNA